MNRRDLQELRLHVTYPSITIVMKCDKERIKSKFLELLLEAKEEYLIRGIKKNFNQMFNSISCPLKNYMVGIFVNKHLAYFHIVPCEIPEIFSCDKVFKLDKINSSLNRLNRYWVVDYSSEEPNLFEGIEDDMIEVEHALVGLSSEGKLFRPTHKHANFDERLGCCIEVDRLPICVVGTRKDLDRFQKESRFHEDVSVSVGDISEVPETIQKLKKRRVDEVLRRAREGEVEVDYLVDFQKILKSARQGLIDVLLIERGYVRSGCEHPVTRAILLESTCPSDYVPISAIDEIIESVRSKGGQVIFVSDGELSGYNRMVATVIV